MPLGDDLRADEDVGRAFGDALHRLFQRPGGAEEVRGQHGHPRRGEAFRHLLGQPLDAGADGGQLALDAAGGAGGGNGFRLAALMADKAFEETMLDHPRVAMIAADLLPAGAAKRDGGIAAPVQEQHRLFPARECRLHRADQAGGNPVHRFDAFLAHVDGAHLGQFRGAETGGQIDTAVFP